MTAECLLTVATRYLAITLAGRLEDWTFRSTADSEWLRLIKAVTPARVVYLSGNIAIIS